VVQGSRSQIGQSGEPPRPVMSPSEPETRSKDFRPATSRLGSVREGGFVST